MKKLKFDVRDLIYEFDNVQFQFYWGSVNSKSKLIDFEYSYQGSVNGFYDHLNAYFDEDFIKGIFDESNFVILENDSRGFICQRVFNNEEDFLEDLNSNMILCISYTQYE